MSTQDIDLASAFTAVYRVVQSLGFEVEALPQLALKEDARKVARLAKRVSLVLSDLQPYCSPEASPALKAVLQEIETSLNMMLDTVNDMAAKGSLASFMQADRMLTDFQAAAVHLEEALGAITGRLPEETAEELAAARALLARTRFELAPAHADRLAHFRAGVDSVIDAHAQLMEGCSGILGDITGKPGVPLTREAFEVMLKELIGEHTSLLRRNDPYSDAKYIRTMIDVLRLQHKPGDVPPAFVCPLTHKVMKDPVVLQETGHSYERKAIEQWYASGHRICPRSGQKLGWRLHLVPNATLHEAIEEWLLHGALATSWQPLLATLTLEGPAGTLQSLGSGEVTSATGATPAAPASTATGAAPEADRLSRSSASGRASGGRGFFGLLGRSGSQPAPAAEPAPTPADEVPAQEANAAGGAAALLAAEAVAVGSADVGDVEGSQDSAPSVEVPQPVVVEEAVPAGEDDFAPFQSREGGADEAPEGGEGGVRLVYWPRAEGESDGLDGGEGLTAQAPEGEEEEGAGSTTAATAAGDDVSGFDAGLGATTGTFSSAAHATDDVHVGEPGADVATTGNVDDLLEGLDVADADVAAQEEGEEGADVALDAAAQALTDATLQAVVSGALGFDDTDAQDETSADLLGGLGSGELGSGAVPVKAPVAHEDGVVEDVL